MLGSDSWPPSPGDDHEPEEGLSQQLHPAGAGRARVLVGDGQSCAPAGVARCVAETPGQKFGL